MVAGPVDGVASGDAANMPAGGAMGDMA